MKIHLIIIETHIVLLNARPHDGSMGAYFPYYNGNGGTFGT